MKRKTKTLNLPFAVFFVVVNLLFVGCGDAVHNIGPDGEGILGPPSPLQPSFASIKKNIFDENAATGCCFSCHKAGGRAENVPLGQKSDLMIPGNELVIPGNPGKSLFVQVLLQGQMPPKRSGIPPVTPEDLAVIQQWVAIGAPD